MPGEAISNSRYNHNRLPTKATWKIRSELRNGEIRSAEYMVIFGRKAIVYIPKEKQTKWDWQAE